MAIARFLDLSYAYPGRDDRALRSVAVEITEGLTLVGGPSGGGKSTLLRCLNGLVPHFHGGRVWGDVAVAGLSVLRSRTRDLSRSVGFVFQDPEDQFVYRTVGAEVAFGLENQRVPRAEMIQLVEAALVEVGIPHLRDRAVASLSGGEKQRVALAGALVLRPALIALDEPTAQLDATGSAALVDACRRLALGGTAIVLAEHRTDLVLNHADSALHVAAGLVQAVPPGFLAVPPPLPRASSGAGPVAWAFVDANVNVEGIHLLSGVNLAGRQGEVIALVGDNGSGKTTLLRALAGLTRLGAGTVERTGTVAYLPQDPTSLLHRPSVMEEVQLTLSRRGLDEPVTAVMRRFGIDDLASYYPRDLSAGQKQRVALAAVLAGRPAVVLLDEPTRGMDAAARDRLAATIGEVAAEGASVVVATHDDALVAAVADRVLRVSDGTVREIHRALIREAGAVVSR